MVAPGGVYVVARGACVVAQGAYVVAPGGACMVAQGGHVWLLQGACMVAPGGACMVFARGGMHGFFQGACVGYDEIRSMSGRYASYWNAFLFYIVRVLQFLGIHSNNFKKSETH